MATGGDFHMAIDTAHHQRMVPMRLDSAASLGSTAELGEEDFVLLTESEVDEARSRTATFRAPGR